MVKHYPALRRPKHHLRRPVFLLLLLLLFFAAASRLCAAVSESEVNDAMLRGDAADKAGDYAAAIAIFASVVQDAPTSPRAPEATLKLGSLQLKTNSEAAPGTFKSLTERYPDSSQAGTANYRLGLLGVRTKYLNDALDAFIAAAGNTKYSDLNRGQASLQAGFVDMTKYFADKYWDKDENGVPHQIEPNADDRSQYLVSARTQFEATEALFATSKPLIAAVASAALGEVHLLSAKPVFAEVAYRKVLDQYTSVPVRLITLAHYGLGQALYGQHNLDGALVEFDEALSKFTPGGLNGLTAFQVAPKRMLADLHDCKVLSLYGLKRFDDSLSAARGARSVLAQDPALADRAPSMDIWEGVILCRMDRKAEGLTILQNVITEHPDTPYAERARVVIAQFEEGGN